MFAFRSVTAITILGVIVTIIGEVLTPPTAGAEWWSRSGSTGLVIA